MSSDPRAESLAAGLDPRWYAKLFDCLGSCYDEYPFTRGADQEVGFLVSELVLSVGDRALDVGCGSCRHAIELAARGLVVTGIDLSSRLLEIGLRAARRRDVLINLRHEDARDMPGDGSYDVALSLCEGAFGLLEDDVQNRRVLERMRAALKPGGRLALNALNRCYLEAHRDQFPDYDPDSGYTEYSETMTFESGRTQLVHYRDRAFAVEELAATVEAVGFAVRAVYGSTPGDFGRHPADRSHPELLLLASAG